MERENLKNYSLAFITSIFSCLRLVSGQLEKLKILSHCVPSCVMKIPTKTKLRLALLALRRAKKTRPQTVLEFKLQKRKQYGYHYTLIRDFRDNNRHEMFR
jgi:hypothetical protein